MRISQKIEYASRALVHLARKHDGESVVRADDIAESEVIPPSFLAQILYELKRCGFATSRRGKTGGWKLARTPGQITMLEVVEALEPDTLGSQSELIGESGTAVHDTFSAAQDATRKILANSTLEKLASGSEPMYFI
ncbi:MAG: RrF2 family transcriptional regulator [Akkermansiaceae bacterium]